MKERMVVGFIFNMLGDVLLVRKARPNWQKGKLNGIGGHVEFNELPIEAMRRECQEEAGLDIERWFHVCSMEGDDWRLEVFTVQIEDEQFNKMVSKTDENVEIHNVKTIYNEITIPNCKWLVPMCLEHMENPFTFKTAKFEY